VTAAQPFLVPSIMLTVLAIPLVLGLVPPNRGYGIRTTKTLSDRDIWRRANVFGGGAVGGASLVYIFVGRYFPMPPPGSSDLAAFGLHLGLWLGPLLVAGLLTHAYIKRL
jgi:hypothetical protein